MIIGLIMAAAFTAWALSREEKEEET